MGYISKIDTKFITFVNRKYKKKFNYFDDYILWLYYIKCKCKDSMYYTFIEKDLWEYSDFQTGSPRENELKNNDWKNIEKDPYGLYKGDDKYVEYLKRAVWKNAKK